MEEITFEVPPESNGDPPSLWFVRFGGTRDRVNLNNERSVTREGRTITVEDTVKLWH